MCAVEPSNITVIETAPIKKDEAANENMDENNLKVWISIEGTK